MSCARMFPMVVALSLLALAAGLGCDQPECIVGPSNLTPEAVESCEALPDEVALDEQIESASATTRDGMVVVTWSSLGLACGIEAKDVGLPEDCTVTGWTLSVELPPELAVAGIIDLAAHPEIRGTMTVSNGGSGGTRGSIGDEPFFVGELELLDLSEGCITGVLHGVGTGDPDPTLGGPELNGGFIAPRC